MSMLEPFVRSFAGVAGAACLVACCLASSTARADSRYPNATQLVVMPGRSATLAVRTTFGVLLSHDAGASFQWVCGAAIGYGGLTEDPKLALTASGSLLVATFDGLSVSPDAGCGWMHAESPLAGQVVIDVAVRPDDPHTAIALTSNFAGVASGSTSTNRYDSRLAISTDDGAHWSPYGQPIDAAVLTSTIRLSKSDPHAVYVSGVRDKGDVRSAVLLVSHSDGLVWNEYAVPLDPAVETLAVVDAVDPNRPGRVYMRTGRSPLTPQSPAQTAPSRLLVTNDDGEHFDVALTAKGPLLGAALAPDGSRIYVGGWLDGLLAASTDDLVFSQRASVPIQCLAVDGGTLYACVHGGADFMLGASTDDGATFAPLLRGFCDVRGAMECSAKASGAVCSGSWSGVRSSLLGCIEADGGGPLGTATTDPPRPRDMPAPASHGCTQSTPPVGSSGAILLVGLGAIARRRRQRR